MTTFESNKTVNTKKIVKWAWLTLLSFGFTYLFFYNGRQNISLVLEEMEKYFGSSTTSLGIVSSAIFWSYAFGQLINGRLGAFFGYKKFMAVGIIGSATINFLISFQNSVPVIAVLWGLNGYFQSMVWANGIGVINKWWPDSKRGFSTGLTTAFSGLAQVVTYLSVLFCLKLNPDWGWRAAFRYPSAMMVIPLIAFFFFFKESPEKIGLIEISKVEKTLNIKGKEKIKEFFVPYLKVLGEPKVIILCFIASIAGVGRYGLIHWIPSYFSNKMNMETEDSILLSIGVPLGQAVAMFLFPLITDKVFKGKREPMIIIAASLTFFGMLSIPLIKNPFIASGMFFIVAVTSMVTGVIWAIAGDIGGKELSSTVVGVLDWAVYMGAAVQAILFAYMKEKFGWPAIFITIGALYVILLSLTLIAGKMKTKRV